ncbi:MAG: cysteine desulfurase NifS [Acidobacteriaceae bacterium]
MNETNPVCPWVYLDNNATTRVDARVVEAMLPYFREHFANPSSEHAPGVVAAEGVRVARRQVQSLIGATFEKEIVFSSGGSESNNTAIFSAFETQDGRNEIITSAVEHASVLAMCDHLERTGRAKVHRIPVDREGQLDLDAYRCALSTKTAIVSIQWANNETGMLFPVERLAAMAHEAGAIFHCDAVQAAGKLAIHVQSTEIDMLSISAHKLHGPKGVGALYIRNGVRMAPLIHGGQQERRRRAGTENTAAIVGFGVAAELAAQALPHEMPRVAALRDRLEKELLRQFSGAMRVVGRENRLPNTLNIAFEDVEADSILLLLDRALIAASSGSACAAGSMEPSHVLRAMRVPFAYLRGAVRFSFSRENSEYDVDRVLQVLPQVLHDLHATVVPLEVAYGQA